MQKYNHIHKIKDWKIIWLSEARDLQCHMILVASKFAGEHMGPAVFSDNII